MIILKYKLELEFPKIPTRMLEWTTSCLWSSTVNQKHVAPIIIESDRFFSEKSAYRVEPYMGYKIFKPMKIVIEYRERVLLGEGAFVTTYAPGKLIGKCIIVLKDKNAK